MNKDGKRKNLGYMYLGNIYEEKGKIDVRRHVSIILSDVDSARFSLFIYFITIMQKSCMFDCTVS